MIRLNTSVSIADFFGSSLLFVPPSSSLLLLLVLIISLLSPNGSIENSSHKSLIIKLYVLINVCLRTLDRSYSSGGVSMPIGRDKFLNVEASFTFNELLL